MIELIQLNKKKKILADNYTLVINSINYLIEQKIAIVGEKRILHSSSVLDIVYTEH